MLNLIKLMLKEEFRLHASFSTRTVFSLFPVMVLIFSFILGVTSKSLLQDISVAKAVLILHVSVLFYGLSVGAFAFLGREFVERRYGQLNLLLSSPLTLPIKFKKVFLAFYIKDVLFYIALTITPLILGLLLSIPFSHFRIQSILFLFLSLTLAFLLAISFSFFIFSVYVKSQRIFASIVATVMLLIVALIILNVNVENLVPTLRNLNLAMVEFLLALTLTALFTAIATLFVEERFESKECKEESIYPEMERKYAYTKGYSALIAKDFVDLKRSRTLRKMLFSFVMPLMFLTFVQWFIGRGLGMPIGFNLIFYAVMIGFFGVLIYSWLNNIDIIEYFSVLPLRVADVVKARVITFLILTTWISSLFLIGIGIWLEQLFLIPLAILVMLVTSWYMVVSTAYLTGLRTNTYLFDFKVLIKFGALALLPQIFLTILSFTITDSPFASIPIIIIACLILFTIALVLFKRIDEKWARKEFV